MDGNKLKINGYTMKRCDDPREGICVYHKERLSLN